ncbi:MAG: InlB B-repeat-containing protein [Paludibacteraceae bacterium]|nr:InlB B-repeat-containing protein [Paludibacteraceae bacterium]
MKRLFTLLSLVIGLTVSVQAVTYCSTSAFGYGRSATGGGDATPTLVSTVDQLSAALNKGKNKVIIITQSLTFTSMLSVQDGANVTLLGLPGVTLTSLQQTSGTSGILYIKRFDNLIIRNLTFVGPGAYDCDGNDLLCFEKVTNAWVDHCDFQDGCDGNFDNKSLTDNVTVSWCRFRYLKEPKAGGSGGSDDHRYTNLLGASSDDKPSDGTYNFTWAYCWWDDGCVERMVRCRNASLHFLNCYWNSSVANYYIGPQNADAYVEGCYIEGKPASSKIFYQNYGGTNGVKFVNSYAAKGIPSNVTNRTVVTPGYSYTALSYSEAKSAVTNSTCGAGATLIVTTAGAVSSNCDGGSTTTYTVTWDATTNGGSCSTATTQVVAGNAIGTLPTATKSGYTFDGWFTAATGGTHISASTVITGNVTYYAQFTESQGSDPTPEGDVTWNFSRDEFNGLGTITATTTIQGLTMVATSSATMTVDANNKTIGDITFTHRLKTGGTGKAESRNLNFAVTGPCTIEVYLVSGGSADRTVNVYSGSYGGTLLTTLAAPQTTPTKQTYEYTGNATTIYMGSANSGINFYGINLIYPEESNEPEESPDLEGPDNASQTVIEGNAITPIVFVASGTAVSISVSNLPAGLTYTISGLTLTISGTPTESGSYTVTATNSEGTTVTDGGYITVEEAQIISGNTTDIVNVGTWWNISDDDFKGLAGDITADTVIRQLHICATSDKKMAVETNSKSIDGINFTHRLKTSGTGNADSRHLWFDIKGDCTIDFYVMSASSSDRVMNIAMGEFGNVSATIPVLRSDSGIRKYSYSYTGSEAKILIYSDAGGGINFYGIRLTYPDDPVATYTVTWENYDGTVLETDADVEEGTTPEYNGAEPFHDANEQYSYTFAGWSPAISPITADISYTAQFDSTVNTYLVEFYNWNSVLLQSSKWEYGATPVYSGPAITREDDHQYTYTFAGWDPQIEPVTEEAFYFATFSSQLRTFSANDVVTSNDPDMGSVAISPQQNEYEYGEQITVTATPQQGYEFSGWQNEDDEIISTDATTTISVTDSTFTAIFVPSTHTKYIVSHWMETLDGNFNREHSDTLYGTTGGWTQAKAKTLTGFYAQSFDQKRIGADGMTEVEIYYYRYQYEIKFIVEGEVLQVSNWRYGATPTYNGTPTKQSDAQYTYAFTGWDPQITTVTGEATYRAVFERAINSYTVTFHANGHGEDPNSQTIEYGKMITCTPMYVEGWEFGGWFRETACQNQWNCQQDVVTANIDLYAKWTPSENMFYEVIYWQQNINDDGYTAVETESKRGTTGQMTEAIAKDYVGFVMLPFNQEPIDVNTTINIYYNRLLFEVQFIVEGVAVQTDSVRYYGSAEYRGETPTKPETDTHYYTFSDWDKATNMPITADVTFTALFSEWTKEDPTDLNEANGAPTARKVMIDNHVYIIIGDRTYDILGNKR